MEGKKMEEKEVKEGKGRDKESRMRQERGDEGRVKERGRERRKEGIKIWEI